MLRLAVVLIAVLAGGGAGWLSLKAMWRPPVEPVTVVVEEQKIEVLTPSVDLQRGAKVGAEHLVWTPWPAPQVTPGMIRKDEAPGARNDLAGRVLRSNLYIGEPVRQQHLARGEGGFLSMVLQPGMLAVGMPISEDETAGGFVMPNDRVDVLHTVVRDFNGNGIVTGATRTILTNVRVLAIGQTTFEGKSLIREEGAPASEQSDGGDGTTLMGKTATLELSSGQAEIMMSAAASGQLSLALRAVDDFGLSAIGDLELIDGRTDEPEPSALTAGPGPELLPAAALAAAAPRQRAVLMISGGNSQTILTAESEVQ